ncbi:hypothetical protein TsFJ059_005932 [Trichoderma semiorbis]|uniref:BTB domain-containing protein n=1 Tax=Trichoderma semiorbis TaxID=1491008 RepID=A0A9P8HCJ8_9HYPO|nr:hypothetical protein TsFJ059_005932 [Trichoderma semiorbis]
MGLTFYEIDPSGDTLLILQNANAPFAILPSSGPQAKQKASDSTPDDKTTGKAQDADSKPQEEGNKPKDADSKPTVQMRLSSKHLTLASKYFQKMTANNWKESKEATPEVGYSYVINANDWDEKALLLLMNIIHGRTSKVPRYIELELLAKIAVLVDYYQCHEAVAFYSHTWLRSINIGIPRQGERDYMLRLVVCLVFSEVFNFQLLTKTIIWGATGPIDSLGLPIQQKIIDALNKSREDAIETVVAEFFEVRRRLCEDQAHSFECSSIHLGALLKAMSKMGVMDHTSVSPWPGHSLLTLEQAIRDIKEPTWKSNCPESSTPPKESTEESTKTTTKSSNDSDGAPSTDTKSPPAAAGTAPGFFGFGAMSSGGSFGSGTSASTGGFGKMGSSGGLFGNTTNTVPTVGLFGSGNTAPTGGSGFQFGKKATAASTEGSASSLFGNKATPAPTGSSSLFGNGTPAPTGGLFGNGTTAPSGGFGTNASSAGLFGKPISSFPTGGLFGKPASDAEDKTKPPPPRCSLAARTSPIIEQLFKTVNSLQLGDYVKKE